ncbi:MAG: HAD hydrolase-like protein [Solirubrobacteraceae bacterium]
MLLLLFDIDGTLLRNAAEAHAHALRMALHEVHGIGGQDDPGQWPRVAAAGRTDMEIAREIALICDVPTVRFEQGREQLIEICVREYVRLVPDDLSDRVILGIRSLLEELGARDDVMLSLVTGNLEPVARIKLDRAGLGRFFAAGQGGFGSDSDDRTDLPPLARERAGRARGLREHPRRDTIVIGDTDRDVACAHSDGVRCFGVSTGPLGRDGLARADAVAHDTAELRKLLDEELARGR